jgi:ATP synthase protein I
MLPPASPGVAKLFLGFFRDGGLMARNDKPDRTAAEDADLARRLRSLDHKLDANRAAEERASAPGGLSTSMPGVARALRLSADFIAGIVLGAALGWGFDRLFGTSPWGLIGWMLLGFIAGTLNVMRSAGLVKPGPFGSGPDLGPPNT